MSPEDSIPLKCCSRKEQCVHPDGPWLPATTRYFSTDNHLKSGLRADCKACHEVSRLRWIENNREYYLERKRQWRRDNPDKVKSQKLESQRRHPESHKRRNKKYNTRHSVRLTEQRNQPERKAKKHEYDKQYHLDHADEKSAIAREWLRNNTVRARETARQWRESNPELAKAIARQSKIRRRAREFNAPGDYTSADVRRIYEDQQGLCYYCGIRLFDKWHEDHVYPISRGGSNNPENIALACKECNLSKADRTLEEWMQHRDW